MSFQAMASSLAAAAALAWSLGASAQSVTSRYTDLSESACPMIEQDIEYWRADCGTHMGYGVHVVVSDARSTVFLLKNGAELQIPVWEITDGAFNGVGQKLEWRGTQAGNAFRPFATILRAYVSEPTVSGEWNERQELVVSKVDGTNVCLVGSVNASRFADANERARNIADTRARAFRCGVDTPLRY